VKLSVVIPARNEVRNIGPTVEALCHRLDKEGIPHEVIVAEDGSTDGTSDAVRAQAARYPQVRLVSNTGLHGFGRAVVAGLDAVEGDAVVIMMADGSDDPDDVVTYYQVLRDGADCAFGSRFVRGGCAKDYPWFKLVLNRFGNKLIQILFRLRYNDVTNAFKGYRVYVIAGCRPFLSPHFNLTVEIPLKAIVRGYSYTVVPIGWRNRTAGRSSFRVQEMGSRYLYILLVVWLERLLTQDDYRRRSHPPLGQRLPTPTPFRSAGDD
jgi:dolichol-phosphate mannosyltransferase